MMNEELTVDDMPNAEIDIQSFEQKLVECYEYLSNGQWEQFLYLFKFMRKFVRNNYNDISPGYSNSLKKLSDEAKEHIIKNLNISTTFGDFRMWLTRMAGIIDDKKALWKIMHSEISSTVKVTHRQSQEISTEFFSPSNLFEFGVQPFLNSSLVNFTNITNEEALIDIFYALAGFVRACNLDSSYETNNNEYLEFIKKLLYEFTKLPDFDAHRFVWLVEAINGNLHVPSESFYEICLNVIEDYSKKHNEHEGLQKLHKLCVFSTSPLMKNFPVLRESINSVYKSCVTEMRTFVKRYIFSTFAVIDWNSNITGPTEQIQCWKLYVTNLDSKIADKPELPKVVMKQLLDDSLVFFNDYYSRVSPTREKSAVLRSDIFVIADVIKNNYPLPISNRSMNNIRFLLLVAAVSGSSIELIENVKLMDSPLPDHPTLGLDHTDTEFASYSNALGILIKNLSEEDREQGLPALIAVTQANY